MQAPRTYTSREDAELLNCTQAAKRIGLSVPTFRKAMLQNAMKGIPAPFIAPGGGRFYTTPALLREWWEAVGGVSVRKYEMRKNKES